jgi:hypothetical protein
MKKFPLLLAVVSALVVPTALVAAPVTVTLQVAPTLVTYGGAVTLSGAISTKRTGQSISVSGQDCGQNGSKKVATVTTTTNGAYTASAKPTINTTYTAKYKGSTSPGVLVKVRPQLKLQRVAAGKFTASATAAQSFVGKYVALQRYKSSVRKYVTVKKVTFTKVTPATAPTQISVVNFRLKIKRGTKLRISMPRAQAGTCYAPGNSPSVKA